jgi:hypothetical protein
MGGFSRLCWGRLSENPLGDDGVGIGGAWVRLGVPVIREGVRLGEGY